MISLQSSLGFNRANVTSTTAFKAKKSAKKLEIFVAMPMGKDAKSRARWNRLNESIKAVSEPIGYTAARIDDVLLENARSSENQFIAQSILNKIEKSNIVIADLSEQNPNVYFELGYALGKGRKILPVAKKGTDLPFDVKDINTVFYTNMGANLKQRLGSILSVIYKNDMKDTK